MLSRTAFNCFRALPLARNCTSAAPPRVIPVYAAVAVTGAIELAVLYSQAKSNNVTKETDAATADRFTSPLVAVDFSRYATDAEFQQALELFEQIVGKDQITSDEAMVLDHADSFFSTHHHRSRTSTGPP